MRNPPGTAIMAVRSGRSGWESKVSNQIGVQECVKKACTLQ